MDFTLIKILMLAIWLGLVALLLLDRLFERQK